MKTVLLLLISLVLSVQVHAQKTFSPGYYITGSGDSIHGELQPSAGFDSLIFRTSATSEPKTLFPTDVSVYVISDKQYYESHRVARSAGSDSVMRFLLVLVRKKLSLLEYQGNYYAANQQGQIYDITWRQVRDYTLNGGWRIDLSGLIRLKILTGDCPSFSKKLDDEYRQMPDYIDLVQTYNQCQEPIPLNTLSGYYVTESGDTIRGQLQPQSTSRSHDSFLFTKPPYLIPKSFTPADAKAYAISNNLFYERHFIKEPGQTDSVAKFLQVLVRGKLSLLEYQGSYYAADQHGHFYDITWRKVKDSYGLDATSHIDLSGMARLKLLMIDCRSIMERIDKEYRQKPKYLSLIRAYNQCAGSYSSWTSSKKTPSGAAVPTEPAATPLPNTSNPSTSDSLSAIMTSSKGTLSESKISSGSKSNQNSSISDTNKIQSPATITSSTKGNPIIISAVLSGAITTKFLHSNANSIYNESLPSSSNIYFGANFSFTSKTKRRLTVMTELTFGNFHTKKSFFFAGSSHTGSPMGDNDLTIRATYMRIPILLRMHKNKAFFDVGLLFSIPLSSHVDWTITPKWAGATPLTIGLEELLVLGAGLKIKTGDRDVRISLRYLVSLVTPDVPSHTIELMLACPLRKGY